MAAVLGVLALEAPAFASTNPRFTGSPPVRTWRTEEFGGSAINWRVAVHPRTGFVYAANNAGVLEFDGVRWRLIALPRGNASRTVLLSRDGRVWVGGRNELAVLEPDATGLLQPVDYVPRLPADLRPTSLEPDGAADDDDTGGGAALMIGATALMTPGGLCALLPQAMIRVRLDGTLDRWPRIGPATNLVWWTDDAVHVLFRESGAHRLTPEGFKPAAGIGEPRVLHSLPHPAGGWLWLTATGPVHWHLGRARELASPEVKALFAHDRPRCALALPDGRTVFGTTTNGAIILDVDGRLLQVIDRDSGLPANRINGLDLDAESGFWRAMHAGLVRVQLDAPLVVHGLRQGLAGGPRQLARLGNFLGVTHGEGFGWRDDATGRFVTAEGFTASTHKIATQGDRALVTGVGLVDVAPDRRGLEQTGRPTLRYGVGFAAGRADLAFVSSATQVAPWRIGEPASGGAAKWASGPPFAHLPLGADQFFDDGRGSLWLLTRDARVRRLDLRAGVRSDAPAVLCGPAQGLPITTFSDRPQLLPLGESLLVASRRGVWRYVPAQDRFEPELRLAGAAGAGPVAAATTADGCWLYYDQPGPRLVHLQIERAWRTTEHPLPTLGGLVINSIFPDPVTRTVWIAAQGTLASYDMDRARLEAAPPLPAAIRRVLAPAGEVLWVAHGYGGAPVARRVTLPVRHRAVRIEFASPAFGADLQGRPLLRFRSRIDRVEDAWTPWSDEAHRDLTNLPDGLLAFELEARDLAGRRGATRLEFDVLAPWWRTGWARGGALLLALGAVAGVFHLRTRRLRRHAAELEAVVTERTRELQRLRQIDRDESAAARLGEEKARLEVLRYQLNPHFLFNALTSVCAQLPPALSGARATIERLTDFCQLTLFRPADHEHPTLADEIAMLRAYLDIEQTRWGEFLRVEIVLDDAAAAERVPSLLLLPLVENALKYGRATNRGAMTLRLAATRQPAGGILLEVANTGAWVANAAAVAAAVPSLGIGLENLRERLQRYYPGAHHFHTAAAGGWVRVSIRLGRLAVHGGAAPAMRIGH